jgi:mono/diheme cytochrome c family protein
VFAAWNLEVTWGFPILIAEVYDSAATRIKEARMLKPLFIFPALLVFALPAQQPAGPPVAAVVPPDVAKLVNPAKATPETLARAKKMYGYDCAMCHGATGDGKGELVADMKLTLKDYTDPAALKDVSDGEIYTIIKNGKGQMTGEGDRAKNDDVWALVVLLRSFAKK